MSAKKTILDILKYVLFFGAGIAVFLWVYHDQDFTTLWQGLSQFSWAWIAASLGVSLLSHLFRAMRWKMLIESIGFKPSLTNTFLSVLVMYLANYALPRLGEVARCGVLKKYEKVPFTPQLGTVLIERAVDVIMLLVMLLAVFLIDWDTFLTFINQSQSKIAGQDWSFFSGPWFIVILAALVILILLLWFFRRKLAEWSPFRKIIGFFRKVLDGIKSILKLKQPWLFILLTLAIYGCYYLMTWFVMLGFPATANLSPFIAFAVLALGSVGMALPVQGGIGTYHLFVTSTLVLYGILEADGMLLALVLHGATTIFVILIGAIALAVLPLINRNTK